MCCRTGKVNVTLVHSFAQTEQEWKNIGFQITFVVTDKEKSQVLKYKLGYATQLQHVSENEHYMG